MSSKSKEGVLLLLDSMAITTKPHSKKKLVPADNFLQIGGDYN